MVYLAGAKTRQPSRKLKQRLFAEYNVSGVSEELTMTSIAKTIWQLQRLGVYEHVQFLRAQGSSSPYPGGLKNSIGDAIQQVHGRKGPEEKGIHRLRPPAEKAPPEEKTTDERLLELGDFVSLDHLDKEVGRGKQAHGEA